MTRQLSTGLDGLPEGRPRRGEVLGGKYRIEREVGSGGMGVVYEVTHVVMTERRFAVKWLLPVQDGGESARRFVREARIAGRIRHPHVVDVYDINMDPDGCFMVMELLEGESLDARLRREGSLSAADACEILIACLTGVAAAHAAGVIHRDLKPANIFLCQTPEVGRCHPKVLDFGISRATPLSGEDPETTETRKGTLIGTPAYMAPEQLRGAACDVRTDVYALGVTLYEMLSGQRAYDAPTYADLIVRVVSGDAEPLATVVPQLPQALCDSVMRAMHRDPKRRFASVAELAQELEAYVVPSETSVRVSVQSVPLPAASAKRAVSSPRPRLVLAAAALGTALTGILWLAAPQVGQEHRVRPAPALQLQPSQTEPSSESAQAAATDPGREPPAVGSESPSQPGAEEPDGPRWQGRGPTSDDAPPTAAEQREQVQSRRTGVAADEAMRAAAKKRESAQPRAARIAGAQGNALERASKPSPARGAKQPPSAAAPDDTPSHAAVPTRSEAPAYAIPSRPRTQPPSRADAADRKPKPQPELTEF